MIKIYEKSPKNVQKKITNLKLLKIQAKIVVSTREPIKKIHNINIRNSNDSENISHNFSVNFFKNIFHISKFDSTRGNLFSNLYAGQWAVAHCTYLHLTHSIFVIFSGS